MLMIKRVMFLKQIHVENFRLLMNYDVILDEELTLFVGKNNAGKTSDSRKKTAGESQEL